MEALRRLIRSTTPRSTMPRWARANQRWKTSCTWANTSRRRLVSTTTFQPLTPNTIATSPTQTPQPQAAATRIWRLVSCRRPPWLQPQLNKTRLHLKEPFNSNIITKATSRTWWAPNMRAWRPQASSRPTRIRRSVRRPVDPLRIQAALVQLRRIPLSQFRSAAAATRQISARRSNLLRLVDKLTKRTPTMKRNQTNSKKPSRPSWTNHWPADWATRSSS